MKKQICRQQWIFVAAALIVFATPGIAYAYLDPGTASIIIQGTIAAIAGIAVAGRLYWSRLKSAFGRRSKSSNNADTPADDSDGDSESEAKDI